MDSAFFQELMNSLGSTAVNLLAAAGILIVGWLVALVISAVVRNVLRRTGLDDRINAIVDGGDGEPTVNIAAWVSKIVFYLILIFALVLFLNVLRLGDAASPLADLLSQVVGYIPSLISAGALLLIAWIVASLARFLVQRLAATTNIDERLVEQADFDTDQPLSVASSLSTAAFWLVFLVVLPQVLEELGFGSTAESVSGIVDDVLGYVPDIAAAVVLVLIGWFIARVVRQITTNLLGAAGVDEIGHRVGMPDNRSLSGLLGTVVYALVLIPFAAQALDAASLNTGPVARMLESVGEALPLLIGAVILLGVAYYAGRFVADLVSSILGSVGLNRLPQRMGINNVPHEGASSPSEIVGYVTLVAIMLFAAAEAAGLMGFDTLQGAIEGIIILGGQVILGLVVFALGAWLANLARNAIVSAAGEESVLMANIARGAILVFVAALALEQMDIGQEIVTVAFTALVYALALGSAIAFGWGGHAAAKDLIDRWMGRAG